MNKLLVIARREYRATVRSKTFVVAIVMMPIFMFGGVAVQKFTEEKMEGDTKTVAVVDHSGKLFDSLTAAAERHNSAPEADSDSKRKTAKSRFAMERAPNSSGDPDRERLALSDRVRNKEIFAFIEIAPDILDRADPSIGIKYYSNEPTYSDIERWLSRAVNDKVRSVRLSTAGINKDLVEKCMTPVKVESLNLFTRSPNGEIMQAEPINEFLVFIVPLILIMLMFSSLMMTIQPLLQSVLEEKMQKISEVLLGSVRPFDLMAGKLLGYVAVAITLVVIYMFGGFWVARQYGYDKIVPMHLIGWFLVYECMAILMYGSLYLAVGSCCNDVREAQSLIMPVALVLVVPMMLLGTIIRHPTSGLATALSLFPPTTPMVMVARMTIPPGVPTWQPIAGIVGTFLGSVLCVWVAGRIFRVGLLMQGKAPRLPDLVKYAIHG